MTPELLALLRHEAELEKALVLDGYGHTLSEVMEKVATGHAQVFQGEGSVLVTEIVETRRGPVLNIWLAAGELEECMALSRAAVAAATKYGCIKATFTGRRGWRRTPAVRADGWRERATIFVKDLAEE